MLAGRQLLVLYIISNLCSCQHAGADGADLVQIRLQHDRGTNSTKNAFATNKDAAPFNTCTDNDNYEPITSPGECKGMSSKFIQGGKFQFSSAAYKWWPPGCFRFSGVHGTQVYHGTNPAGTGRVGHVMVCKRKDNIAKLVYPAVDCPTGYSAPFESECRALHGYTFQRVLTSDANWIDGCFEWYSKKGATGATENTRRVYYNNRKGAITGAYGGNKICTKGLYELVGAGCAGPGELWGRDVGPNMGKKGQGVDQCYAAVMANDRCHKDYFSYGSDKNCGCKSSSETLTIRLDAGATFYKLQR